MKKPELAAPGGSFEKIKTAAIYGADAVYFGLKDFSLRKGAKNLSFSDAARAVEFLKKLNKKAYITLNIIPKNSDITKLKKNIKKILALSPHAFIVSDLAVFNIIRSRSRIPIHISTQANCVNYETASFFKKLGAKRIITGRELGLKELKEIKQKTKIEIEIFVHGAMCVAYSGRCLLSYYMTGRRSNLGDCAHPCRWAYIVEETRPDEKFSMMSEKNMTYILNSKDLCLLNKLPALIKAGIDAFKIEGRMKSQYYAAVTTAVYRKAMDEYLRDGKIKSKKELTGFLNSVSHRPYTEFPFSKENSVYNKNSKYIKSYKFTGLAQKDGWVTAKNRMRKEEILEVFAADLKIKKIKADYFLNDKKEKLDVVHANAKVLINGKKQKPYSIIRKLTETKK